MAGVTEVNDGIALALVVPAAPPTSDCASATVAQVDIAIATAPTHLLRVLMAGLPESLSFGAATARAGNVRIVYSQFRADLQCTTAFCAVRNAVRAASDRQETA